MTSARTRIALWTTVAVLVIVTGGYLIVLRRDRLPPPDSPAYEEVVRRFYRGLASLEVGLLDDAKREFAEATVVVPAEPASWANLGLAHLRLGDFDGSAQALQRAAALAPSDGDIAFLEGQLEASRGRLEEAVADFRRAIQLDPRSLRARYALAQEVERAAGPNANDEAQRLLDDLHQLRPDNLAVLLEQIRLAAKRGDSSRVKESVAALAKYADKWPAVAVEQYRVLQSAADAGNSTDAGRAVQFLRNALVRLPAFRESLVEIKPATELIAEPFKRFLRLPSPSAMPSPPDGTLAFTREPLAPGPADAVVAFSPNGSGPPVVFAARGRELHRVGGGDLVLPFPAGADNAGPTTAGVAVLDWNRDFRMDLALAGVGGVRLLTQSEDGTFTEKGEKGVRPLFEDRIADALSGGRCFGVWTADIEMDGDLDLIIGLTSGAPVVLRNNGDGSWREVQPFAGIVGLRGFVWGDFDGDGDPDAALLDAAGGLHLFENRQAGEFREMPGPGGATNLIAVTLGDVNADGVLDVVTLDTTGTIRRLSYGRDGWQQQQVAVWNDRPQTGSPGTYRLFLADLDNNGALDLVASGGGRSRVWLANASGEFQPLATTVDAEVSGIADLNGDGLLDLVGVAAGEPVRLISRSRAGYHWQVVRPRAQPTAGDQRINSFGIGGDIEIRSGLLTQKQPIAGPIVHFGLGTRTGVEVTRIVWPNGIMQADFDRRADEAILTEQRLKGSCPWVFADDGTGMRFVTDFLWRSPLGLRINAQDTAGVTQTEDRVKIRGDQLAAKNGSYDVRVTAELWETHFIDHVALMVVDHPADTEVFVDERFAKTAPALTTHVMKTPKSVDRAWDESGRDVTELVTRQDGRYLSTFELGDYQGIARDHFVDIDVGREIPPNRRLWLVAAGWIYPTDSSINVAIGQGRRVQPKGLSLEAQDPSGRWTVVSPDLGFPAGKNKTILIDLTQVTAAGVAHARRLRLRTNLEIYWDWLAVADDIERAQLTEMALRPEVAELRYRGFSQTDYADRRRPEIPVYGKLANVTERWRDLVGYYTRFGDVRELVAGVDDRYVIMNAGDELRMSFRAPAPPATGWKRDFVLVGDGWEKDGDYNTTFSKTVGPLPTHARADYESSPSVELEDDPVYRRHPQDWQRYHTRFVTPHDFLNGLR
jgi:tetratricopeptide (TPR) repeat protein